MEALIILGAGTMAQEVTELVEESSSYQVVAYAVSQDWQEGKTLDNKPVLSLDDLPKWTDRAMAIRGIFSPDCLEFIEIVEGMGFNFARIIHPSASVARSACIDTGSVVNRLVAIGTAAIIGHHVLVNRGCTIGHHTQLKRGATLGPGVNIAGSVTVGDRAFIGMGANIIQEVNIKDGQKIRAGDLIA